MEKHDWTFFDGKGPVLGVALHAGHRIRSSISSHLSLSAEERRREEDPMTEVWATVCDHFFINHISRFEVDLNRARNKAVYTKPEDAWGISVWKSALAQNEINKSLKFYDDFYKLMKEKIEALIARFGQIIILDIHSYNHQREGEEKFAPKEKNPDIDLGLTTSDKQKFSGPIKIIKNILEDSFIRGEKITIGENIRYPDGGHFPEWVYANYKENVCCITLEYKKSYMNEWTGSVDLEVVEEHRQKLQEAVTLAKKVLL